jgi:protein-disulfide isomerase
MKGDLAGVSRKRAFGWVAALLLIASMPCLAQANSSAVSRLSPELAWKIEVLVRSKMELPKMATLQIGPRTASEIPGYDRIPISYSVSGESSQPVSFLISRDGSTLVQFNKFDITADPHKMVTTKDRPMLGGDERAPVWIIVFDDLECPFCARLHATLLPAVLDRYKDMVRVVYMDMPSAGHPWALRGAVDTACLAKQSSDGFWTAIETIHQHAGELGGPTRSLAVADESLDAIVKEEGQKKHVDATRMNECVAKQDTSEVEASIRQADALHVDETPTLFVNGARVEGAVSKEFLFHMIDSALIADGKTPPQAGQ